MERMEYTVGKGNKSYFGNHLSVEGKRQLMVSIGKDRKQKIQQEGIEETKSYKNTTEKE